MSASVNVSVCVRVCVSVCKCANARMHAYMALCYIYACA